MESEIVKFYRNKPNKSGYTFVEVYNWDDIDLEENHDYIQWLFPLNEPSRFNRNAPILTKEDAIELKKSAASIHFAMVRMTEFFFTYRKYFFRPTHLNHNSLRITRIIKSLKLIGLDDMAKEFYEQLYLFDVSDETKEFWNEAYESTEAL